MIFHLQLITKDIADSKAKGQVIAVFHLNAGHVTLNDDAYKPNEWCDRKSIQGLVFDLIKRGTAIELRSATAPVYKWRNADLVPGVKVNTDAVGEMSRLAQEGFLEITGWDLVQFKARGGVGVYLARRPWQRSTGLTTNFVQSTHCNLTEHTSLADDEIRS